MEGNALGISVAGCGADAAGDDFKYICGLSTILVATIQEVKDRVSQMEFIFCTQLFPHIQAKSKLLHARHAEDSTATRAAEDEWRKREAGLASQLEELKCGKRRAEDRLLQLEASLEAMKGKLADAAGLAAEHDAEKNQLLGRLEELNRGKRGAEDRQQQLETSLDEMKGRLADATRLAAEHDAEKKRLLARLEEETKKDEVIRRLQREIGEKAAEISREREAHQQLLLQQMESKDNDLALEKNRVNLVTARYKDLKSQYNHLLAKLDQNEGSKSPVNSKSSSASPPSKRKLKDLQDREKESIQLVSKTEDQKNASSSSAKAQQTPHATSGSPPSKRKLKDLHDIEKESIQLISKTEDQKDTPNSSGKAHHTPRATSARSLFSNSRLCLPSHPTIPPQKNAASTSKTDASSSFTRPSHWRETRARKEPGVVDPHDDFLDTPLEAVRNTVRNPTAREEALALAAPPPQDMDFNNSDDETQDINIATQGLNNIPVPKQRSTISIHPPNKGFKYTEPVRKKADRENLKGVECKQCKKFYDAVLPDGRVNGNGTDSTSMRCEHHDGVSRHRYRYAPPSTPEGFWNIGFESEM
ncbi:protein gamma response 1-like [Lolium rigidum]|uniref:protein gamma response 1-like n=1 Tax=Lolium rigidum TaxID=89674 RepID=UPI001F5CEB48|nr:protein gamma response 1-like [Lolium rigidum]